MSDTDLIQDAFIERLRTLETENARLKAQLLKAKEALESVEWIGGPYPDAWCPFCMGLRGQVHDADCKRQKALAAAQEETDA